MQSKLKGFFPAKGAYIAFLPSNLKSLNFHGIQTGNSVQNDVLHLLGDLKDTLSFLRIKLA